MCSCFCRFKLVDPELSTEQARRLVLTLAGDMQRSLRSFSLAEFVYAIQQVAPVLHQAYMSRVDMPIISRYLFWWLLLLFVDFAVEIGKYNTNPYFM